MSINNEILSNLSLLNEQHKKNEQEYKNIQIELSDVSKRIKQTEARLGIENDGTLKSKIEYVLSYGSNLDNYKPDVDENKRKELQKQIDELTEQKDSLIDMSKYLHKKIEDYPINKKLILEVYVYKKHELTNTKISSTISKYKSDMVEMLDVHYDSFIYSEDGTQNKYSTNVLRFLPISDKNTAKWINFETDKIIVEISKDKMKKYEEPSINVEYMKIQNMINNIKNNDTKKIFQ